MRGKNDKDTPLPSGPRRSPGELALALERSVQRLVARLQQLDERVEGGDESAWGEYAQVAQALAAILAQLAPERRGAMLTTAEMAARLRIAPKTLLRHAAQGTVRPALQVGNLIRWGGNETTQSGGIRRSPRRTSQKRDDGALGGDHRKNH